MTRKHYREIAETLRRARIMDEPTVKWIAEDLVITLKRDNPRFDRSMFMSAIFDEK